MSDFEILLHQQLSKVHYIHRALANFKKLGQSRQTKPMTTTRLTQLKELMKEADDIDARLTVMATQEQRKLPYFTEDHMQQCRDDYYEAYDYISSHLVSLEPGHSNNSPSVPTSNESFAVCKKSRLPTFELPKFTGQSRDWVSFSSRFQSLIINDASLSAVERLQFLLMAVSGKARDVIGDIAIIDSNFQVAWDLLRDQYEDKHRILYEHLKTLTTLPNVTYKNPESLSNLRHKWNSTMKSLKNFGRSPETCQDLAIYMATSRFDAATRREWKLETYSNPSFPTYDDLNAFLRKHAKIGEDESSELKAVKSESVKRVTSHLATTEPSVNICVLCRKQHVIQNCDKFKAFDFSQRDGVIRQHKVCRLCLSMHHTVSRCSSELRCTVCSGYHHTLMHRPAVESDETRHTSERPSEQLTAGHASSPPIASSFTLLPTARVKLFTTKGRTIIIRALLDQGSQSTMITERVVQALHLPRTPYALRLRGVGESVTHASAYTTIGIGAIDSVEPIKVVRAIVLRTLSSYKPRKPSSGCNYTDYKHLKLADDPLSSLPFDIVIGANEYGQLLLPGLLKGEENEPVAQLTVFGWVLSGPSYNSDNISVNVTSHCVSIDDLQHDLEKFWELEKFPDVVPLSAEDRQCENHFLDTHKRSNDGRYIVRLPFRDDSLHRLGLSRNTALRNLSRLNTRLKKDSAKAKLYSDFLSEYERLGHMQRIEVSGTTLPPSPNPSPLLTPRPPGCTPIPTNKSNTLRPFPTNSTNASSPSPLIPLPSSALPTTSDLAPLPTNTSNSLSPLLSNQTNIPYAVPDPSPLHPHPSDVKLKQKNSLKLKAGNAQAGEAQSYYMPHHAVFREGSLTTQLRVVFNASGQTSTGVSLNDCLLAGPKLQIDLPAIILRWRQLKYVLTADISKMYRQILIDERDRNYQRIVWTDETKQIRDYCLNTVTYGMTSAPFLALRVVKQLAIDDGDRYPLAVPILNKQMYVDDLIFGAHRLDDAISTRDQVISLLNGGGFKLHKWSSNDPQLLNGLTVSEHTYAFDKDVTITSSIKILGIIWRPVTDAFGFEVVLSDCPSTKRTILSAIARLFDPMGWLAPVITIAKLVLQELWRAKCDWDQLIPDDLFHLWSNLYKQLPVLTELAIPRWSQFDTISNTCELHGFSDASSKAYAACVYLRTVSSTGNVTITLLMAKSKMAPLKTISIPRLELCASVLLVNLLHFVRSSLSLSESHCFCWTDSTIVLHWIRRSPDTWSTFVANRVSRIQEYSRGVEWRHVVSEQNSADCASRGVLPTDLLLHSLWWSGPAWLIGPSDSWPNSYPLMTNSTDLEERRPVTTVHVTIPGEQWDLENRYSSWNKLIRVTAYLRRFITRSRNRVRGVDNNIVSLSLNPSEISESRTFWLRHIQKSVFPEELSALSRGDSVHNTSSASSLAPIIDNTGLIRARGRLKNSDLTNSEKYPILLKSHPLVTLIIRDIHLRMMHGGPQITLACLRQEYWLLRARQVIRSILHRCVVCIRHNSKPASELMGDLPVCRVNKVARAFTHTGLDYAGPMHVRATAGRGIQSRKAWICLFICMTTKAVHIELVSSCSTPAFLAAFQRFVSRRGSPSDMYSDNATTFRGASTELQTIYNAAINDPLFRDHAINLRVQWHFIPPRSPHFGGLWEAGIKSIKHHLNRFIGEHKLTFEEFTTVLCKIEAILNSRPLGNVSDNIDDCSYLTPGHFLIGTPLVAPPELSVLDLTENRLSRWQLVQKISENVWKKWRSDYLHSLQQRVKWRMRRDLARVGRLVIIKDSLLPPGQWALGRIVRCHVGDDGLTRVVDVKTATSQCKRAITTLCFLPDDINAYDQSELATPS